MSKNKVVDVEFEETTEVETKEENENHEEMTKKESKFLNFVADNPGVIIPLVTGITMLFRGAFGFVMSAGNKTYKVEDDVTGLDFTTRHALNNSEIRELGYRKSQGQSTGDALDDMGLLKNERRRK